MEFKFRAIDDRTSTHLSPSSSISYFTEQALRAGYANTELGRTELQPNQSDVREAIIRELEKERIREEIIAAEITRKRLLEAEVRRELLMEREMAMRRAEGFSLLPSSSAAMRFESRPSLLHQSDGASFEERLGRSLEERLAFSAARRELGMAFEMLPLQRNVVEAKVSEVKPLSEVSKERVILLAKPDPNLSGAKRKAVTPPPAGANELPSVGSKKKPKEEWSCALCQVSATSERGLNEHLQGKKHRAKEAGLRAQRMGKNSTLLPKKFGKPTKISEATGSPTSEKQEKLDRESLQVDKTVEASVQEKQNTKDLKEKNDEPPMPKQQKVRNFKKKNREAIVPKMSPGTVDLKKKKFRFWCELCQIGAYSQVVMDTHKNGKKHLARLQENQDTGAVQATTIMPLPQATQKAKTAEVVAEEANEGTMENFEGDVDGVDGKDHHTTAEVVDQASGGTN